MPAQRITGTLEKRFWVKVDKNGPVPDYRPDLGPCWIWTACLVNGYGQFTLKDPQRTVGAHRVAYELLVGPIPEGLHIDHLRRNPPCVNPSHLEPVTCRENALRGIGHAAQNAQKTHCKRGHELVPGNIYVPPAQPNYRECLTCKRALQKARPSTRTGRRAIVGMGEVARVALGSTAPEPGTDAGGSDE